jgi:glycine dehydrogenase subunit 2
MATKAIEEDDEGGNVDLNREILEPTVYELSAQGRTGVTLPACDVPERSLDRLIPVNFRRREPAALPEIAEPETIRHFTRLSTLNHHIDRGFYPLGSCTMKYNPKINEETAALPGFAAVHPFAPEESVQGALELIHVLCERLAAIAGMDAVSVAPVAGAQSEFAALLMVRAYHRDRGETDRDEVLVPDSAHGTNPASAAMAGYRVITLPSGPDGLVDLEGLKARLSSRTACFMLTNPNTLGLFERNIVEIAQAVHQTGGLLYMDGANLNALLGIARPGDMGFDLCHFNLHKTFSTPHGGGGPGSGAVGCKAALAAYLPAPRVVRTEKGGHAHYAVDKSPKAIGRLHQFFGNFGMFVRAYTYILSQGHEGLRDIGETSILNANYLLAGLKEHYDLPYPGPCQHEFVLSANRQKKATGVRAADISKRLLDFGIHAPTTYFPLIVPEALMIEPTESETIETLDRFVAVMKQIAREAAEDPDRVKGAPHSTPVSRIDEARAARDLAVTWPA